MCLLISLLGLINLHAGARVRAVDLTRAGRVIQADYTAYGPPLVSKTKQGVNYDVYCYLLLQATGNFREILNGAQSFV